MFCVNGAGFALATLTPLASRYAGVDRFYERYGRQIVIADMQLTIDLVDLPLARRCRRHLKELVV